MLSWNFAAALAVPVTIASCWGAANLGGLCVPELRRLSEGEFIATALEWRETRPTSVTRPDGQVRTVERPTSAEEYMALHPGCCSVVSGPGADAFEEPDVWDRWFDNFSTIVRVKSPPYRDGDGAVLIEASDYYVSMNNCAVIRED